MAKKTSWRKRPPSKGLKKPGSATEIVACQTKTRVAEILARRPGLRQVDIAALLNITKMRVSQIVKELAAEWKEERITNYEIDLDRRLREIASIKQTCQDRLKGCKSATQGSRWVEMQLKAITIEARLLGLNAPDVHEIRGGTVIDKDARDAVARAMSEQHKFKVQFGVKQLPDIDTDEDSSEVIEMTNEVDLDEDGDHDED